MFCLFVFNFDQDSNPKKITKSIEIVYGLRNFIGNANKFSKEKIFINLKSDSETTEITIEDDGDGYPRDIISKMTGGKSSNFGNLSNTSNWAGQHKDGLEFGLKNKVKVGGKVVSIVQIKVTGKDKFTIAYLDWDNGKRPLLTRKIVKNVSGKNLPKELKRNVKVG